MGSNDVQHKTCKVQTTSLMLGVSRRRSKHEVASHAVVKSEVVTAAHSINVAVIMLGTIAAKNWN